MVTRREFIKGGLAALVMTDPLIALASEPEVQENTPTSEIKGEMILDHKNDPRTMYVFLQIHRVKVNGVYRYTDDVLKCQTGLLMDFIKYFKKGFVDGYSIEGLQFWEGNRQRMSIGEHSDMGESLLKDDKDSIRSRLDVSNEGIDHYLKQIPGLAIYGWEYRGVNERTFRIVKELNSFIDKYGPWEKMTKEQQLEATRLNDRFNATVFRRSELSYSNTLRNSDELVREGRKGNLGIVIGAFHEKDYRVIAREEAKKESHPAIVLVDPAYCKE